jgi:hypothetical protein
MKPRSEGETPPSVAELLICGSGAVFALATLIVIVRRVLLAMLAVP